MAKYHSPSAGAGSVGGGAEGKIRAAHLLVKHTGSRRPSSWKEVRSFTFSPRTRELERRGGEQTERVATQLADKATMLSCRVGGDHAHALACHESWQG